MHAFPGMHACRDVHVMRSTVFSPYMHICVCRYSPPGNPVWGIRGDTIPQYVQMEEILQPLDTRSVRPRHRMRCLYALVVVLSGVLVY